MQPRQERIEVEVEDVGRDGQRRLQRLFGPMVAGLVIDALDLATFGPIGLYTGFVVGGVAGYWLAPMLGFSDRRRWMSAAITGVYCTLPLTGFLPVASVAATLSHLFDRPEDPRLRSSDTAIDRKSEAIEVEYEARD